jgi:molybdopterin converting factor small subunit
VKVTFLLFAQMRMAAHLSRVEMDLPQGTTLGDALEEFDRKLPKLRTARASCMFAIGLEYGALTTALKEGDEISLIPPVQGG